VYKRGQERIRLLIIGAGDAAARVISEIQSNINSPYEPVCCLDDDPTKYGRNLLGVPVRGPIERLAHFVKKFNPNMILIAIPSIGGNRMREITGYCVSTGLPFKTLPSIHSFIDGRVSINSLRDVNYEDFIGRAPVKLDTENIGKYITNKTILVTGAGGSIGSELCRQIMKFQPALVILVDSSEYNLHQIDLDLKLTHGKHAPVHAILGKIQDEPLMKWVFQKFHPAVVFHAAAYKHVPILELNPWEGIFTNVVGTWVVMQCAEKSGTERMVLVSTDKAVNPTSVLGATKRLAELMMHTYNSSVTKFMSVRFGNVVGSSGSVIQVFERQIKMGGPVTITHPDITRYFMSIPEACQLILQAGALGKGKEIFVLQMGEPVKIIDMARDLIRLAGKEPDRDIEIIYTGLRPGEKLHEELIAEGEKVSQTPHEKIMVLTSEVQTFRADQIEEALNELISVSQTFDAQKVRLALKKYVPEYTPYTGNNTKDGVR
jgi:FlaA1/EpsC-like NDP-sugar epimerase